MTNYSVDEAEKSWICSLREELEWIDDVSEVGCTKCGQVMLIHYTGNCGHKFCAECKDSLDNSQFLCPHEECGQSVFYMGDKLDQDFKNKLSQLRAHCTNRRYGCHVTDQFCHLVAKVELKMIKLEADESETDQKMPEFRSESAEEIGVTPDFRCPNEDTIDPLNPFAERDRLIRQRDLARDLYDTLLKNVKWAEKRGSGVVYVAKPTAFDESIQRQVAQRETIDLLQAQVLRMDTEYKALQKHFSELSTAPAEKDEIRLLKVKLRVSEATLVAQDVESETLKGQLEMKMTEMDDLRAENEMLKEVAHCDREVQAEQQRQHREMMEGLMAKSEKIMAETQGLQNQLKNTTSGNGKSSGASEGRGSWCGRPGMGYFLTRSEYEKMYTHMQCACCSRVGHLESRCPLMWTGGGGGHSSEMDGEGTEDDSFFCQSKSKEFEPWRNHMD